MPHGVHADGPQSGDDLHRVEAVLLEHFQRLRPARPREEEGLVIDGQSLVVVAEAVLGVGHVARGNAEWEMKP